MRITQQITINRAVPDVFAYIADVENMARWMSSVMRVQLVGGGCMGVGFTYQTVGKVLALGEVSEQSWEVIDFARERHVAVKSTSGLIPSLIQYTLEPAGEATLCTCEVIEQVGVVPWAEPLMMRMLRHQMAHDLAMLKELLEYEGVMA